MKAYERYIHARLDEGAPRVRIIGQPVWPQGAGAALAVTEWKRYDSMLNLVFAELPVRVMCLYDTFTLSEDILADAHRTHAIVRQGLERETSPAYLSPAEFFEALDTEHEVLPPPPDAPARPIDDLRDVRRLVVAKAAEARLDPRRVHDLELAVCEVATNAVRHGARGAMFRVWATATEVVCDVTDTGPGMADRLAGYTAPGEPQAGGLGLMMARLVCDAVEVRTGPDGTLVRLHVALPPVKLTAEPSHVVQATYVVGA
jgi:anti-sigma regulatory factor (Ser/Thr protein kinase)